MLWHIKQQIGCVIIETQRKESKTKKLWKKHGGENQLYQRQTQDIHMSAQGGDQCFLNCKIENVKFGNNAKKKKSRSVNWLQNGDKNLIKVIWKLAKN